MTTLVLSPRGTIGRAAFVAGVGLVALLALGGDLVLRAIGDRYGILSFLFALAIAWCGGCLSRKRLHDLGRSGAMIAAFLAVYIALAIAAPFALAPASAATGPWQGAVLPTLLLGGPMAGWLGYLALVPGRQSARRLALPADEAPVAAAGLLISIR